MKNLTEFLNRLIHVGQAAMLTAATLSFAGCSTTSKSSATASKAQLMFVQVAEDIKVDAATKTLRLVNVNQQTLYFSDRPVRIAGHVKMADYLQEWTGIAGKDNFGVDPPNATLSVYEAGQPDNTIVVVEITNPVVDGDDLLYTYKVIDGVMPATGGAAALFIDWVPARPGVGAGGVGRPGVGVGGVGGPGVGGPRGVGW